MDPQRIPPSQPVEFDFNLQPKQMALNWCTEAAIAFIREDPERLRRAFLAFEGDDMKRLGEALKSYFGKVDRAGLLTQGITDRQIAGCSPFRRFLQHWGSSFANTCTLSKEGRQNRPPELT